MNRVIWKSTICIFILALQLIPVSSVRAWRLPVEIATTGDDHVKRYNKLIVGIEPGATDDFDNLWDTPALISQSDPESPVLLRAYIQGRDGGEGAAKYLWKDVRGAAAAGDTTWEITVDSVPSGRSVVLSWDIQPGLLKPGEVLLLKDSGRVGAGNEMVQTDVTRDSSYVYVSGGEEPRVLSLVLSKESSNTSDSGGGSGFGCGTIKPRIDGPPAYGTSVTGMIMLFSPFFVLRWFRLKRSASRRHGVALKRLAGHDRRLR